MGTGGGPLTYCAISRLGFVPIVGCEVVESVEDVLVGDTCEGGGRVGPGHERGGGGGGGGHGWVGGERIGGS